MTLFNAYFATYYDNFGPWLFIVLTKLNSKLSTNLLTYRIYYSLTPSPTYGESLEESGG